MRTIDPIQIYCVGGDECALRVGVGVGVGVGARGEVNNLLLKLYSHTSLPKPLLSLTNPGNKVTPLSLNNSKTILVKLFLVCWAVVGCLLLLELGAKIYIEQIAGTVKFRRYASVEQFMEKGYSRLAEPHRYAAYIPKPGYRKDDNRHNALGYRGEAIESPKPDHEFRIVCLGGSTTYGSKIKDYKLSYPYLLQSALQQPDFAQVRVINAGMSGYTTWESLANLQLRILDLEPDLIIIYHAYNDVLARMVWPPDAYRADNSGYRGPAYHADPLTQKPFLSYFNLGRILLNHWSGYSAADLGKHYNPEAGTALHMAYHRQVAEGTYPSGIFTDHPIEDILATNHPIYFRQNLANMIHVAKAHQIQVLLATFVYNQTGYASNGQPVFKKTAIDHALEEHNRVVRQLAHDQQVHLLDLAGVFPQQSEYFYDYIHFTPSGNRIKAKLFAEVVRSTSLQRQHPDSLDTEIPLTDTSTPYISYD